MFPQEIRKDTHVSTLNKYDTLKESQQALKEYIQIDLVAEVFSLFLFTDIYCQIPCNAS